MYDWVGSLSPNPDFFQLIDYKGGSVCPSSPVFYGVFDMCKGMEPVAFLGFGKESKILLSMRKLITLKKEYEFLHKMRKEELAKLNNEEIFSNVSRENIYDDMIRLYRKRNTMSHLLKLFLNKKIKLVMVYH